MKYIKYIILLIIPAIIVIHGCESNDNVTDSVCIPQPVSKKVLLEFFTNAGCIPCVQAHGFLDEINANTCTTINDTSVIIISYHTRYPYIFDSLYRANVPQNDARANYYSVQSTPKGALDGSSLGAAFSSTEWKTQLDVELKTTAYLGISLDNSFAPGTDSGTVTANLSLLNALPVSTDNVIHFIITQNNIPYVTAPNGITKPDDVMRTMITGSDGENITIGTSNTVVKGYRLAGNWDADNCYITVFVQNKTTQQVFGVERIKIKQ
jgi:hypothetical protein